MDQSTTVAYFSMEVGLNPRMPTYAGGLGILAGDTLRAAADVGLPMVGVSLLHRKGYFRQHLDARGKQTETTCEWTPQQFLEPLPNRVQVSIEGRVVRVGVWRYPIRGVSGHVVPVYLLDTAMPENSVWDRTLTDCLNGEDQHYRLCQEVILGIGGVEMLQSLGHENIRTYHMNEGHSALLVLGLLRQEGRLTAITPALRDTIRQRCVFTTHTPIPAGHDQFPIELARRVLGDETVATLAAAECCLQTTLNMTYLALYFSHYVNGVAMRHGEISQSMFPDYPINSITNGVHAATWTAPPFQRLFDRHIPQWRRDNLYLRYAVSIPLGEIQDAHAQTKRLLLQEVERYTNAKLDPTAFTIAFARRATAYKRPDLLFQDLDRLRRIAQSTGPFQVLYSGKAHPADEEGKQTIRHVFEAAEKLRDVIRVVYLEEYDMALAQFLCAGVDLWLNTPQKPHEASGTSGMKAALNGIPSLSVRDGWWLEGHLEGITGWAIGEDGGTPSDPVRDAASLGEKLEHVILPMYYRRREEYVQIMRNAIALNGSFF
ncbi:MAG TPA: alpha-glucan family phosphorylase, partial [Gemmataceae bacterium]|nr:alpha-glucan family phosphorylase [Gemmataceae bacterium]